MRTTPFSKNKKNSSFEEISTLQIRRYRDEFLISSTDKVTSTSVRSNSRANPRNLRERVQFSARCTEKSLLAMIYIVRWLYS